MAFLQNNIEITSNTAASAAPISQFSGYLNAGDTSYGSGGLLVFGNNSFGQLGQFNSVTHRSSPVFYSYLNWLDVAFLRNGQGSLAVKDDNKVIAYPVVTIRTTPEQIALLYSGQNDIWTEIAGAGYSSLAIQSNGTLWSWGLNDQGQLGLSDTTDRSSPIKIGTLNTWTKISTGYDSTYFGHSLAIQSDGTLWAWGNNSQGQLGVSDRIGRFSPTQVGNLSVWTQVVAAKSGAFSLAIQSNGTLWAWGSNVFGQLASGTTFTIVSPAQVGSLSVWTRIAAGGSHSLAIQSNGTLWGWGRNSDGQLGLSDLTHRYSPVQVGALSSWSKITAGTLFSAAIRNNGTLWSWGINSFGQLGLSDLVNRSSPVRIGTLDWREIAAGGTFNLAINSNGTLWSWGSNFFGQLGLSGTSTRSSPVQVGNSSTWTKISAGVEHSLAIQSNDTLWSWGSNTEGQLGSKFAFNYTYDKITTSDSNAYARNYNFKNIQQSTTQDIPLIDQNFQWNTYDTGRFHFVGIRTDGTAWSIGNNQFGQLAISNQMPVTRISGGESSSLAIQSNGTLWAWGRNQNGQLGLSDTTERSSPVQVGNLSVWTQIAAGYDHTLAIQSNGTLWAWGSGAFGGLGLNTTTSYSSPIQIGNLSNWSQIGAGQNYSRAIQSNGTLWAWGNNSEGQLGLSDLTHRSSPVQVGTLSVWTRIGGGDEHTLAIQSNGTLWAWGRNFQSSLGLGDSTNRSSPVQVGNLSVWTRIINSCNSSHSLAIQSDGTLWSWGWNTFGQLGNNTTTNSNSPVQIGSLSTWTSIDGGSHSIALQSNGTLWSWGYNISGQLGLSDTTNRSSPVQVGSLSNWTQIAAGGSHSIALLSNAFEYIWGQNAYGQLGSGSSVSSSTPNVVLITPQNVSSLVQIGSASNWSKVIAADYGTMLIDNSNQGYVFGKNNVYQLGLSDTTNRSSPTQITYVSSILDASLDDNNIGLVDANGSFWLAGNYNQAILINAFKSYPIPYYVGTIPTARTWTKISAGGEHFLALQSNGTLWSCGYNANNGQLGLNDLTSRSSPAQVGALLWKEISAGSLFSVAIQSNGTLWAWGRGNAGQLGNNSSGLATQSSPVRIGALSVWTKVSAGAQYCLAIQSNGTLWAWGSNFLGALGNNSTSGTSSPIQVGALSSWAQITAGGCSAAIQSDGTLWAWGDNQKGQLGQGDTTSRSSPTQIGSLSVWTRISAGAGSECLALQSDGTLWAWGNNFYGQLGLNTSTFSTSSPVQVGNLSVWTEISSSSDSTSVGGVSLALQSNGTLWAWGNNSYSQLALTNIENYSSPVQVGTLSNWARISSGAFHTLAIQSNSTLWSWGANSRGQLGLAGTFFTYPQNALTAKNEYSKVSTNSNNFLLTKSNRQIWSFGINTFGALGLNTSTENFSPVQIGTINTPIKVLTTSNSTALMVK